MIADKIIWPKHYNPAEADYNVEAEVVIDKITGEELWPYLTNIADITRTNCEFVDAEPVDPNVNDPHLKKGEEFTLQTDEYTARCRVVETVAPKDDRPGRFAWEGVGMLTNSPEKFTFMHMWTIDVTKRDEGLRVVSNLSVKGKVLSEQFFADINQKSLAGLVRYTAGKESHTNHPNKLPGNHM